MKRWYQILRIGGYVGGLVGVAALVLGRQASPPNAMLAGVGGGLIVAGFACFLLSYVLYVILRLRRTPAAPRNPP